MRLLAAATLCLLAVANGPARAAQSFDNCAGFIDALPVVISTQGVWCLRGDLSTAISNGIAITVAANNVTIDCNDYKVGGLAAGMGTTAVGIRSSARLNTTIRNCSVRGFQRGIHLIDNGSGHVVERNRLEGNTYMGIGVVGSNASIRDNLVIDTGGTTAGQTSVLPIYVFGDGISVMDNTVAGMQPLGPSTRIYGIYVADRVVVGRNRVSGMPSDATAGEYGIYSSRGGAAIHDNVVSGPPDRAGSVGISCPDNSGVAKGNILIGVETGVRGCTLSGNVVPLN